METKKKRIEELVGILNEASGAYYQGQEEKMSNYEWDAMFDELTALEQQAGYILPDLPFNGIFIPLGILCVTPDHRFFHLQQSLQDHECFTLNDFGS